MAVVTARGHDRDFIILKSTDTKPPNAVAGTICLVSDTPAVFIQSDDPENGVTNSGWVDVTTVAAAGLLALR